MKNTLLEVIMANKGFSNMRITSDLVSVDTVKAWHAKLDTLRKVSYKVASDAHNGQNADLSEVFAVLGDIFKMFPELPNGAKLRSDADSAITIVRFCATEKNTYSSDYMYKKSQIALEKKFISSCMQEDGVTPKKGQEDCVKSHAEKLSKCEEELDNLKKVAYSISKQTTMVSASTFYKKVEDYIAEKALGLSAKTPAEIEAEERARKDARNKKANARKAAKKAAEKVQA